MKGVSAAIRGKLPAWCFPSIALDEDVPVL